MKKLFFYITLIFIVAISSILGWLGKTSVAFIFSITCFTAILFANLDKLSFIKFYGLEAQLKETISEANATITQLKSLAMALSEPTISLTIAHGILTKMPLSYRLELIERINDILNSLSISTDDIQRINDLKKIILMILHGSKIVAGIENIPANLQIRQLKNGQGQLASPKDYEEFLKSRNLLTPEKNELIIDLQYFIDHCKFRRPDLWSNE